MSSFSKVRLQRIQLVNHLHFVGWPQIFCKKILASHIIYFPIAMNMLGVNPGKMFQLWTFTGDCVNYILHAMYECMRPILGSPTVLGDPISIFFHGFFVYT